MKPYYKTSDGKVVELGQRILDIFSNNIIELVIPAGCKEVYCYNNQLKELVIPAGCEYVSCWDNQLKELVIPDGCKEVWADMKSVTELNKIEELRLYL